MKLGDVDGLEELVFDLARPVLALGHFLQSLVYGRSEYFGFLLDHGHHQEVLATGPLVRIYLKEDLNKIRQLLRKGPRYFRIEAFLHPLKQSLHVVSLKRRLQSNEFINDTSKRPNVALKVVGFVSPNLWTCIVWRTGLSVIEALLVGNFGNVHVAQLNRLIMVQKYVCRFEISVHYIQIMKRLQTINHLDSNLPKFVFCKLCLGLLTFLDFLE